MIRRLVIAITSVFLTTLPALGLQPPPGQEGFVPLDQLPAAEQMPAPRLVIGAYAFFLLLMMFYLWTIWRRINKVEKEMHDLERRQGGARR